MDPYHKMKIFFSRKKFTTNNFWPCRIPPFLWEIFKTLYRSSLFGQKIKKVTNVNFNRTTQGLFLSQCLYGSYFTHKHALCTIFTILLTLWNSEEKNGLLIKLFCFSSDFDETWWSCSYPCVLQFHQVFLFRISKCQ